MSEASPLMAAERRSIIDMTMRAAFTQHHHPQQLRDGQQPSQDLHENWA